MKSIDEIKKKYYELDNIDYYSLTYEQRKCLSGELSMIRWVLGYD